MKLVFKNYSPASCSTKFMEVLSIEVSNNLISIRFVDTGVIQELKQNYPNSEWQVLEQSVCHLFKDQDPVFTIQKLNNIVASLSAPSYSQQSQQYVPQSQYFFQQQLQHSNPPDDQQPPQAKSFVPYHEYMRSQQWKDRKNAFKHLKGHRCEICGNNKNLSVHHKSYESLGQELDEHLILLCESCHNKAHNQQKG